MSNLSFIKDEKIKQFIIANDLVDKELPLVIKLTKETFPSGKYLLQLGLDKIKRTPLLILTVETEEEINEFEALGKQMTYLRRLIEVINDKHKSKLFSAKVNFLNMKKENVKDGK